MPGSKEPDSDWYRDSGQILDTLRRGRGGRKRPPRIGGYDGLYELRRGGQGIVYVGRQRSTNRQVAIKVLSEGVLGETVRRRRFEREIELVAGMRDRRIVGVYDSGFTEEDHPYLVMEYIDGVPLDEYLAGLAGHRDKPLTLDGALRLFVGVCQAVNHAHQRGVIHRDLKPSNILIDPAGEPHVLDFGVAKAPAPDAPATATEGFLGTLAYASPEQVTRDPMGIDVRSDVYALGVILYQTLTGRLPYPTSGPLTDVLHAITSVDPVRPSAAVRSAPPPAGAPESIRWQLNDEIDTITLTALAKDPERRYATAGALGRDVQRFLDGQAIEAKRDNPLYVLRKLITRHKLVSSLLAILLLAVVAFSIGMSALYQKARVEAEKATQIRIFLEDTLASVDPASPGEEVTVREVLDEAVHWIDLALADQPEVRASIHATMGNSYRALGQYEAAETQLQASLEIARELHGDDSLIVSNGMSLLALLYSDRGEHDESIRILRDVVALRRRRLGDDHLSVAYALSNLGLVLQAGYGPTDEAGSVWRQALAIREAHLGPNHPDTAMSRFRLAEWQAATGDLVTAAQNHAAVLAARRDALRAGHPDIERSLLALGRLRVQLGEAADAEPLLRECLALRQQRLPENHYRIAEAASALGACLVHLEQFEEAERLLMNAVEGLPPDATTDNAARWEALNYLAQLYDASGRPREAQDCRDQMTPSD